MGSNYSRDWNCLGCRSLNTVFERLFDLLDENYNPIIEIGKDVSAAAVLISAIISAIVGIFILAPPLIKLLISWFAQLVLQIIS